MVANLHMMLPYWFIVEYETGHDFATSLDSKISGFTCPHIIRFVADLFFSTLEISGERKKNFGFAVEFARCVWMEAVSGKKKLRIQKYISGYVSMGP